MIGIICTLSDAFQNRSEPEKECTKKARKTITKSLGM